MRKLYVFISTVVLFIQINDVEGQSQPVKVKLNNESGTINSFMTKDFTERTFIKGLAMYRNKIEDLAGTLIILNEDDRAEVIGQFIRFDLPPVKNINLSDVLYCSKVNSQFSANGSYMIASASATNNSIIELIVTDINGILIPEQSIPYFEICKASKNVDKDIKKKIFYIRSVKLTSIHSKAFREISVETAISGVVFSANGKVYNSSDQFKVDYVVSVDMVSLSNLLMTKNCEDIITTNELASREKAEKAEREAEAAETDRKLRENDLRNANSEVAQLKENLKLLQEALTKQKVKSDIFKLKTDSLSIDISKAETIAQTASQQLTTADKVYKVTLDSLSIANIEMTGKDKLIQKSGATEIKEIKILTDEEIKKLGFQKKND